MQPETTIKEIIVYLVEAKIIKIQEAFDLTDDEARFLYRCYNPTPEYKIPKYSPTEQEARHNAEDLLPLYRKNELSFETHCISFDYLITPFGNVYVFRSILKEILEENKKKINSFKDTQMPLFKQRLSTFNPEEITEFFGRYANYHGYIETIYGDKEFTMLVIYRFLETHKGDFYSYNIYWNSSRLELTSEELNREEVTDNEQVE